MGAGAAAGAAGVGVHGEGVPLLPGGVVIDPVQVVGGPAVAPLGLDEAGVVPVGSLDAGSLVGGHGRASLASVERLVADSGSIGRTPEMKNPSVPRWNGGVRTWWS